MGQKTRNAAGLGQAEAGRGLGRGPCELRGLRGRRGWRTWAAMQRWSRQGPVRKDGARDSTAMEIQPAVGGRGFKLRWTELLGQRSDSAGVASGQTPKKPEEQASPAAIRTSCPIFPVHVLVHACHCGSALRTKPPVLASPRASPIHQSYRAPTLSARSFKFLRCRSIGSAPQTPRLPRPSCVRPRVPDSPGPFTSSLISELLSHPVPATADPRISSLSGRVTAAATRCPPHSRPRPAPASCSACHAPEPPPRT